MQKSFVKSLFTINDLKSTDRDSAIRELVSILAIQNKIPNGFSIDNITHEVIKRENVQSTALGEGYAFPHARINNWSHDLHMVIGWSKHGVEFASMDGQPVHVIFLLISSIDQPYVILQKMSALAKALAKLEMSVTHLSKDDLLIRLNSMEDTDDPIIYASDFMLPIKNFVEIHTPIEDVAHLMHIKQLDVIPVIDENRRYFGEISSLHIFQLGMPEFFKNLPTVSFVRHIDPFEKYFHLKEDLTAKDVLDNKAVPIKKDATLLEIVFELTMKGRQRLFIIDDDGRLEGYIDRFCIIDKILFL